MDVSIVIVNYNTLAVTRACLDSVFEYTSSLSFEVILVDNASADGSKEFFEKDSRIIYKYSPENLGFGRANNLGYSIAKGRYIFLLNSDTLLVENSILKLLNFMEKFSDQYQIAGCGCRLIDSEYNYIHSYGFFPSAKIVLAELYHFFETRYRGKRTYTADLHFNTFGFAEVEYITGADLFLKNEYCKNLDYFFDPNFFMYYEEIDLQYRLAKMGYKRCIIDSTSIVHLEGGSLNTDDFRKKSVFRFYQIMLPSMYLFLNKNYSVTKKISYQFMFTILLLPKILMKKMTFSERLRVISICIKNSKI